MYDYGTPGYRPYGMTPRALLSDPQWHEKRTAELDRYQPGGWSALVDPAEHPRFVTSPAGGLVHMVEFVVRSYAPTGYGDASEFYLVCGQLRSHKRCIPVSNPAEVCHLCHDRHWLKTGHHLPALPQSGCELTRGTAYVSHRAARIRAKAAAR